MFSNNQSISKYMEGSANNIAVTKLGARWVDGKMNYKIHSMIETCCLKNVVNFFQTITKLYLTS